MANSRFQIDDLLPEAFDNKENEKYFKMLKDGDESAKNILKEHNLRLIISIIDKQFCNVEIFDKNELFSIGAYALNKAVDTFDLDKQCSFSTYATTIIINEILMAIRKTRDLKRNVSLESIVYESKYGEIITLENVIASDDSLEEKYLDEELKEEIRNLLEILTETERSAVELYYGFKGYLLTQHQIGEILGVSQSAVAKILSRSLVKISKKLISRGLIEAKTKRYYK